MTRTVKRIKMKKGIIFIIPAIVALTSCSLFDDCIEGNGNVVTEERSAEPITAIANSTSFQVIYVRDDDYSITVEAESNILPYIETKIKGGSLEVKTIRGTHCLRCSVTPVITVTAPFISELINSGSGDFVADPLEGEEVKIISSGSGNIVAGEISTGDLRIIISGSGDVTTDYAVTESFSITLSGSGDLDVIGEAGNGKFIVSGSGSVYADEFSIDEARVTLSGSGSVHALVNVSLDAIISGSGNIYLYGDPEVSLIRTGSGRIINQ
jgi:hypothetical protein